MEKILSLKRQLNILVQNNTYANIHRKNPGLHVESKN